MRLVLASVGRLKDKAERQIFDRYADRISALGRGVGISAFEASELIECRAATPALRKADEAKRILAFAGSAEITIALDEDGQTMSSAVFARWLARQRDGGVKTLCFLIGGSDGHGQSVLDRASMRLSLGPMTLPHGLARIVLAEQIYRTLTILGGHPYHRS